MNMDPITSIALAVTVGAVGYYLLYLVVRKAVSAGILDADAARQERRSSATDGTE